MIKHQGASDLYRTRLDAHAARLSPASLRVACHIDANRASVLASSASKLAAAIGTSDATVIRTVQSLGFKGLGDLKQALLPSLERETGLVGDMRRTLADVGRSTERAIASVLDAHDDALRLLRSPESLGRIAAAVGVLHPAERIAIFGIGPSASLAGYVATLLARGGRQVAMLNATGSMLADQMLSLRVGDALLVLAYGRVHAEVVAVFGEARRLGLPVVLVTDSLDERLARSAAVVLRALRGRADRVALHGATVVCLESLVLGLAAANTGTVASLERLNRLRGSIRQTSNSRLLPAGADDVS